MLTSGFAYGKDAVLKPKKVMYSITTGGAGNKEELEYYKNKIDGLYQDIFGFMGWDILPAFIAHGVQQKNKNERNKILSDDRRHIAQLFIAPYSVADDAIQAAVSQNMDFTAISSSNGMKKMR